MSKYLALYLFVEHLFLILYFFVLQSQKISLSRSGLLRFTRSTTWFSPRAPGACRIHTTTAVTTVLERGNRRRRRLPEPCRERRRTRTEGGKPREAADGGQGHVTETEAEQNSRWDIWPFKSHSGHVQQGTQMKKINSFPSRSSQPGRGTRT